MIIIQPLSFALIDGSAPRKTHRVINNRTMTPLDTEALW